MKRTIIRIVVALLTFCLGVAWNAVWRSFHSHPLIADVESSRVEEWHRLYEAAGLSGDVALWNEVNDRLLCANSDGIPDAWPVDIEGTGWCKKADGTLHQLRVSESNEYGSFCHRISSSHQKWVFNNMDFVRSISNACRAKEYVRSHQLP